MQKVKYYRCPIDNKAFKTLDGFGNHMRKFHPREIPNGWSDARYFYYLQTGKSYGTCIQCGNKTDWNEVTQKYNRFCNNPKCKEQYKAEFQKRMIGKYGKVHLLDDPNQQRKMLASKKMSGKYKFEDKGEVEYTGTYEKDFLFMLDKFMHLSSKDVMGPSPHTYYYFYRNKNDIEHEGMHFYIPDFYIPSLNLEIEIKQNTNTHPKLLAIDHVKELQKDDLMNHIENVNYIKIMEKDYSDFFKYFLDLKESIDVNPEHKPAKIIPIKQSDIEATKDSIANESISNSLYFNNSEDYENIRKITSNIYSAHYTKDYIDSEIKAIAASGGKYMQESIDDIKLSLNSTCLLYIDDHNIVSSLEIFKMNNGDVIIDHLSTYEGYRNKGYASQLIKTACDKFSADKLKVYKDNYTAIKLYKSLGFKIDHHDDEFYYMISNNPMSTVTEASFINDNGTPVPKVCPICGSKVGVFFKGEPVYLCTNKKCNKYFGVVKFNGKSATEGFTSNIDDNYASKGKKALGLFSKKVCDSDEFTKWHEKFPKELVHVRSDNNTIITLWITNKEELVSYIAIEHKPNGWNCIQSLEVMPNFKGYGLGSQLMKYAKLNDANILYVNPENKIAIKLYENNGWKFGKDKNRGKLQPMYLDTNIKNDQKESNESFLDVFASYIDLYPENLSIAIENAIYDTQHKYPVYIILMHSGTFLANMIKKVTKDDYSHACISFDASMNKIYSFGRKKLDLSDTGFAISSYQDEFFKNFTAKYGIYVTFVTKHELMNMKLKVQWFIDHDEELSYDLPALLLNALHLESEHEKKWFCSRFVAEILRNGMKLDKKSSLYRPQDLAELNNISLVNSGDDFSKYNYHNTKAAVDEIMRGVE